jgi:hypothetical protein
MMMILFIGTAASLSGNLLMVYGNRMLPRALHFAHLTSVQVQSLHATSDNVTLGCTADGKNATLISRLEDNHIIPVWAELESDDDWTYPFPTEERTEFARSQLRTVLNSLQVPGVAIVSQREKLVDNHLHIDMTALVSLYGTNSLYFVRFELDNSGKIQTAHRETVIPTSDWEDITSIAPDDL